MRRGGFVGVGMPLFVLLRGVLFGVPLVFLAVFFLYPLAAILWVSFAGGGRGGGFAMLVGDGYYLRVFWFTTWQAGLSTVLTLVVGLPAAYVFSHYAFPGRQVLRALATVPFVMPTIVVATAFRALFEAHGVLNVGLQQLLMVQEPPIRVVNTLGGVLLAHVFYNYTIVLRIVGGFWGTLDGRIAEAAAVLGASRRRVFWEVTMPLLLPAIGAAALLVFIFCFCSFGVVLLLGGQRFATVEVEIYRQVAQVLHLDVASGLALVQMCMTLLMTMVYLRLQAFSSVRLERRARSMGLRAVRGWCARLFVGVNVLVLLVLIGAPLVALVVRSLTVSGALGFEYYRLLGVRQVSGFVVASPLIALRNSLLFAVASMVLALVIGVPSAYVLARSGARGRRSAMQPMMMGGWWARGWVGAVLDPLLMLPLGTSAVTLGLGYALSLGRPPWGLMGSPVLVPMVHALLALPFVVRTLLPALRGLDVRLGEAAGVLGAGPVRVLREVDLPLLFPAVLVSAVFAFTVSIGEFGATLLLSRPEYPTVPVLIYRFLGQPGARNYGQALALGTVLLLVSGGCFWLLERVRYRDIGDF